MNIRKDKELNILAKAAGKKATEVETIIVNQLIQKEMIQDDPKFWGCTLFDSVERDVPVSDVVGIIKATGISVVRSEHLDAFLNLVLVEKEIARYVAEKWKLPTPIINVAAAMGI